MSNPPNEQTLITLFIQEITDGPDRTYLFRFEFDTLEEAIRVAEQEEFSVKQAHVNSNSHRLPRRQENGCPEPMDLSYAESESTRVINYKKLQTCNRCQNLGHYAYECSAPNAVPRTAGNSNRQATKKGPTRGSDAVAKTKQRNRRPKNGQGQ